MMKQLRRQLEVKTGNLAQLMGVQKYRVQGGMADNTSVIRVRNGLGLDFTITPDRGLDIFEVYFKGIPLAWISKNGLVGNQHFDPTGLGWLRSFPGGMLNTCGLRNVGPPVEDAGEAFGLHGRMSNTPAERVNVAEAWQDDKYQITVSGQVREASTFAENLLLERSIEVNNQDNEIVISDTITNQAYRPEQVMLLYHLNWGFPLLSLETQLELDTIGTKMRDPHQNNEIDQWHRFSEPIPGYQEVVYFHDLKPDDQGRVGYTLKNEALGIQVAVSWQKEQLPYLTQWKMMGESEYVVGLEPGNCYPMGRIEERKNNRSVLLQPGQQINTQLNIEIRSF